MLHLTQGAGNKLRCEGKLREPEQPRIMVLMGHTHIYTPSSESEARLKPPEGIYFMAAPDTPDTCVCVCVCVSFAGSYIHMQI